MTASTVARIMITKVGHSRYHVVTVNAEGWSTGYLLAKSQRQACQIAGLPSTASRPRACRRDGLHLRGHSDRLQEPAIVECQFPRVPRFIRYRRHRPPHREGRTKRTLPRHVAGHREVACIAATTKERARHRIASEAVQDVARDPVVPSPVSFVGASDSPLVVDRREHQRDFHTVRIDRGHRGAVLAWSQCLRRDGSSAPFRARQA